MGRVKAGGGEPSQRKARAKRNRDNSYGKRQPKAADGLNDLERKFIPVLDDMKARGLIRGYHVHAIKLVVVDAKPATEDAEAIREATYTPEFLVEYFPDSPHRWAIYEIKGFLDKNGDAWLKFKAAASRYSFPCYMVQWKDKKWHIRRYGQ